MDRYELHCIVRIGLVETSEFVVKRKRMIYTFFCVSSHLLITNFQYLETRIILLLKPFTSLVPSTLDNVLLPCDIFICTHWRILVYMALNMERKISLLVM